MDKANNQERLPSDMENEILLRLPVKTLKRFQCASKTWYSLISSSRFTMEHFHHSQDIQLLLTTRRHESSVAIHHLSTYNIAERSRVNNFCITVTRMLSTIPITAIISCRGLVCLTSPCTTSILVCNPSTKELIALPDTYALIQGFGFGYAASSGVFKVLSIFYIVDAQNKHVSQILTLGTTVWREVKNPPPFRITTGAAPFLHGALHLLPHSSDSAVEDRRFIAAFDVEGEEYKRIPLPESFCSVVGSDQFYGMALSDLGGSLCLTFNLRDIEERRTEVWLLQDYKNARWVKKYTILLGHIPSPLPHTTPPALPVSLIGDKIILLNFLRKELWYYNLEDKAVTQKININGPTELYVQSLFTIGRRRAAHRLNLQPMY